jgi:hypothetical protein
MSNTKIHGVSIPAELLAAAKQRAQRQSRSFSGHIRHLIMNDLGIPTHGNESPRTGHGQRAHKSTR